MKPWERVGVLIFVIFLSLILLEIFSKPVVAGPIPQGDTQVSPLGKLNVSMGIQYQAIYAYGLANQLVEGLF